MRSLHEVRLFQHWFAVDILPKQRLYLRAYHHIVKGDLTLIIRMHDILAVLQ